VITATNRNVEAMMRRGAFRDDLYYRIAVVTMRVPALRSYLNNLDVLCQMFITHANSAFARDIRGISPAALAVLRNYDFPGNVRELRNIIDHAVIVARDEWIEPRDLSLRISGDEVDVPPPAEDQALTLPELRKQWVAERERVYLAMVLDDHNGNVAGAATALGIDRTSLYRLLKKYRIHFRKRATSG
jgi:DNA-binding NtrC family response regulator